MFSFFQKKEKLIGGCERIAQYLWKKGEKIESTTKVESIRVILKDVGYCNGKENNWGRITETGGNDFFMPRKLAGRKTGKRCKFNLVSFMDGLCFPRLLLFWRIFSGKYFLKSERIWYKVEERSVVDVAALVAALMILFPEI